MQPRRRFLQPILNALLPLLCVLLLVGGMAGLIPFGLFTARMMAGAWVAAALSGTLGTILVAAAIAALFQVLFLLWRGRRVTALVVGEPGLSGTPRFQFDDEDGQAHEVSGAVVSMTRTFHAGEEVPLLYLRGRPGTFVVDRFGDKWGAPSFCFLLGLILLLVCLVFTWPSRAAHSLVFLSGGAFFWALAVNAAVRASRSRQRADGVIVEAKRRREVWAERVREQGRKLLTEMPPAGSGESETWLVAVEYEDATGAKRRGVAEVSRREPPQVGDPLPIRYDPEHPSDLRPGSFMDWLGPPLAGAAGAVFIVLGVLLWSGALL